MAVYKDGDKWRVIYRYTNWNGERKQTQKRGFATKREAQAWEHEAMLKQDANLDMTFESFFEIYKADKIKRLKVNTWESKEHIVRTKIMPYFGWRKIAAILIGVLTLSGIAIAAVWSLTPSSSPKEKREYSATAKDSVSKSDHSPLTGREARGDVSFVFDNVTLDSIAKDIAAYHHLDIDLQNEQAGQLRFYFVWHREQGIEQVIDDLNHFERLHIMLNHQQIVVE